MLDGLYALSIDRQVPVLFHTGHQFGSGLAHRGRRPRLELEKIRLAGLDERQLEPVLALNAVDPFLDSAAGVVRLTTVASIYTLELVQTYQLEGRKRCSAS